MSPIDQDLQSNQTKIKTNKFSSIQALKNDRLDYKADLESLFYILCYLAKIDPTLFDSLEKKKILANQATLFVYKKQLIDQLGSNYYFVFIYWNNILVSLYSYLNHISSLKFKALPNYEFLIKLFLPENGIF